MAEAAQGTEGDTDGNYQIEVETSNENAIPEEQNQKDSLNGNHDSNANIDDTNVASSIDPQSAEHDASSPAANADGRYCVDNSDADSSDLTMTESSTISKSREDKIRIAREVYERERQRKISEIIEAQRQAEEFRQKQQEDRRRKIDEMRRKDQERRKTVEDRRRRMQEVEEERRASLLRRSQARESRIDTMRSSRMPCRMAMSCVFGAAGGAAGDAALAALSRPRVAFGSSSPRDICRPLTVEPDPLAAVLNQGTVAGRSSSAFHVGCLLSAHARSHRRAASAPGERTQAGRVRRDMRTGYVPPRPASARTAPDKERQAAWKAARSVGPSAANSVSSLTPNRGNRSSSRGANTTSTDRTRRRPLAIGQARSASVTPSSSFVAEKPGQVEKALSGSSTLPRRAARSADRRQAPPKPSGSPEEASSSTEAGKTAQSAPKLRSRSQGGPRPRPMSQVVTPAEMDSVFARLAQPKQRPKGPVPPPALTDTKKTPVAPVVKEKRGTSTPAPKKTPTPAAAAPPKTPSGRERRQLPSPPKKEAPAKGKSSPTPTSPPPPPSASSPTAEPKPAVAAAAEEEAEMAAEEVERPVAAASYESEESDEPEPVAFDQMPSIMTQSMPAAMFTSTTKDITEDEYRLKIAEQRRLAREKLERERQEQEEARQARAAQERERREQARRVAEEARRRMEEEEARQREEEEQARLEEEERAKQRKEEERLALEVAELERQQRKAREEEERLARKARLDKIMSRVKRGDDSPAPAPASAPAPAAEPTAAPAPELPPAEPVVETPSPGGEAPSAVDPSDEGAEAPAETPAEPPAVPPSTLTTTNGLGGGPSPVGDRDSPVGSVSPSGRKSSSPAEAPKFKSALLQSMLAGGRLSHGSSDTSLRRSSGSALSILQSNLGANNASQEEVGASSKGNGGEVGAGAAGGVPHSFSLDALSAAASHRDSPPPSSLDGDARSPTAARAASSHELDSPAPSLPNGDNHNMHHNFEPPPADMCEDEDVDGPALMSANIRTRLDEAKAAPRSDGLRENDNTRTAFEEILNLPHSTAHHDHLDRPVDPVSGAWFEQPAAPKQREQTAISDLLS